MTSDAILVELRSLPGAPDTLRERVRSLPEPQPRFAWTLPRIDLRRVCARRGAGRASRSASAPPRCTVSLTGGSNARPRSAHGTRAAPSMHAEGDAHRRPCRRSRPALPRP